MKMHRFWKNWELFLARCPWPNHLTFLSCSLSVKHTATLQSCHETWVRQFIRKSFTQSSWVGSIYLATSLPLTKQAPQLFFFFWNILNRKKGNENEKRMSVVRTSQLGPDSRHTAKVGNRQPSLPMCSQGSWSKVGS